MMVVITNDKKEADETKTTVEQQEKDANEQAAEAKAIAADAQHDLDEALPALDAAVASLKNLSRNDVVEVKSLANPPMGVRLVMEATCIMFDEKPKMVADPNKIGALQSPMGIIQNALRLDCPWEAGSLNAQLVNWVIF